MEKLIELFNEYERPQTNHIYTAYEVKENMNRLDILQEFIKWLVDNDKIDRKKIEIRPFSDGLVYSDSDCTVYRSDTTYEMLLMLLAISDTPIEYLISILK